MKFIIAIKSGNLESLNTAYNFTTATLKKDQINIILIFFYQNGTYILLDTEINKIWSELLLKNNLLGLVCSSSCKKRGINKLNINAPFQSSSIIEFINNCSITDRIIHF